MSTGFPALDAHYAFTEMLLTEKNPDIVERICLEDIGLAEDYIKQLELFIQNSIEKSKHMDSLVDNYHDNAYYEQKFSMYRNGVYTSFKTLAILYEKRGNLQEAINICQRAIALGFTRDGTQGGMAARLDKLNRKLRK